MSHLSISFYMPHIRTCRLSQHVQFYLSCPLVYPIYFGVSARTKNFGVRWLYSVLPFPWRPEHQVMLLVFFLHVLPLPNPGALHILMVVKELSGTTICRVSLNMFYVNFQYDFFKDITIS